MGARSQSLQSGSLGSFRQPEEVGSNSLMSLCPGRKSVLPESSAAQEPQLKVSCWVLPTTSSKCCVSKQFLLPASPFIKKQALVPFNNPLPFLDISLNHAAKLSEPLPRINYFSSFSPRSPAPATAIPQRDRVQIIQPLPLGLVLIKGFAGLLPCGTPR